MKKRKSKTKFICKVCQSEFERFVYPSQIKKCTFEYCSTKCRNIGISRNNITKNKENRLFLQTCPICNHIGRRKQEFCNNHLNRTTIWTNDKINYLITNYSNVGAKEIAKTLNLTLIQVRNKANAIGLTLSKSAAYQIIHSKAREYMTRNNPMFDENVKEKVKQFYRKNPDKSTENLKKLAKGRAKAQKNKPTKLELKLFGILNNFNVEYIPFCIIKDKFVVDCKIKNIIIQADGEYWHGHPRFEPLTDRQKQQQKRDKAQDKYLTACGYNVIRIWENDMTIDNVKQLLENNGIILVSSSEMGRD